MAVFTGNGTDTAPSFTFSSDTNTGIYRSGADELSITTAANQRVVVDSSGKVLIGIDSAKDFGVIGTTIEPGLQVAGTNQNSSGGSFANYSSTGSPCNLVLASSKGGSVGTQGLVDEDQNLGRIVFDGSDGTGFKEAGRISCAVDGTPGSGNMPGKLVFAVTNVSGGAPVERLRLSRNGNLSCNYGDLQGNDTLTFGDTVSTSTTQRFATVRGKSGPEATDSISGFGTVGWGGANGDSAYTTASVSAFEAQRYEPGTNQTVTDAYGFRVQSGFATATNNYGFYGELTAVGTKYNFYAAGNAPNYFAGTIASLGSYGDTTASAANVVITSSGSIQRSTSSIRYKTDVETLENDYADNVVFNSRPVWYRSLANSDNSEWSYYGLIAEEVAELDPRLVFWGRPKKEVLIQEAKEAVIDEHGNVLEPAQEARYGEVEDADAELAPEGVQYDRLTVMLINVVQRQQKRIEELESRLAAGGL